MKRKLTPQEKKRHSLAKDHPLQAEAPKAFRRKWPKSKRIAEKVLRAKIRDHLHALQGAVGPDLVDDIDTTRFKRPVIRKWGCASLAGVIARKQHRRIRSKGRKQASLFRRALEAQIRSLIPSLQSCTIHSPLPSEGTFYAFLRYNLCEDATYRWSRIQIAHEHGSSRIVALEPHDGLW
ncbi:MAG TPA: hypothetical protein PKO15_19150 [Fibrobacteria bacterium]|nr:hypothetical protein [Fibrobacteria bacterium]HOX51971.1 hypothetical protein [Fibrobacteria bacterium]